MIETLEGDHNAKGLRFGLVVSRFNEFITNNLHLMLSDMSQKLVKKIYKKRNTYVI